MSLMSNRFALVALTLVTVLLVARPARSVDDTVIVLGGEEVLRIRADSGGFTARQRADALRKRVLEIYDVLGKQNQKLVPADVTLDRTPGRPAIRVRGLLLLSVTEEDARVNGSSIEDLARIWHVRLRDALVKNAPVPPQTYPDEPSPSPSTSPAPSDPGNI